MNDFLVFLIGHSFPDESKKHRIEINVFDLSENFDMLQFVLVRIDGNLLSFLCVSCLSGFCLREMKRETSESDANSLFLAMKMTS